MGEPDCLLLLLVISVGFPTQTVSSDIGPRALPEAYVHVYNLGSGDMLPGAPCLRSVKFV